MKPIPPLLMLAVMIGVVLGIPLGLYALLTRTRRRTMREIKAAVEARGWEFRPLRWRGDPAAFRIDGRGASGPWILKSTGAGSSDRKWSVCLGLRFPNLAGDVDFAVLPRDSTGHEFHALAPRLTPALQATVAKFSGTAASATMLLRDGHEMPSGLPAFDSAYRIMTRLDRFPQSPVDAALAGRILQWPADAIKPHSVLAWRDPFGVHVQARLPGPANWETLIHLTKVAEGLCTRLPGPIGSPQPRGLFDRLVARLLS